MSGALVIDKCSILNLMYIERFYLLKALEYSSLTTIYVQIEFDNARLIYPESFSYFNNLTISGDISIFPLQVEDLVEMANVPQSKRASNAELSCFIVAKRIGGKIMTDDHRATKYIQRYVQMPPGSITDLVEILIASYLKNHLGDHELRPIQETLANNKFNIKTDLAYEAARRRLLIQE